MDTNKNYLAWAIRILVAGLFILSAFAKLYPSPYFAISTFEVKQLYTLGFSEQWAPYFSRTLIGIELALGLLLLQNHFLRKIIVPATILLLLVFIAHLSYVTFSKGNSGSCGCFGELLPMTPVEAIIKNIITVGLLGYLYYLLKNKTTFNHNFWILTSVTLASILGIFMIAPIQPIASKYADPSNLNVINTIPSDTLSDTTNHIVVPSEVMPVIKTSDTPLNNNIVKPIAVNPSVAIVKPNKDSVKVKNNTSTLIKKDDKVKPALTENLTEPKNMVSDVAQYFAGIDKGKQIVCYFAPGCDHCQACAKELTEMKAKDPSLPPVTILFMNEEADKIPDFFKFAGTTYPYKVLEVIPFWKALGTGKDTPGIKYLWNGNEIIYYYGINDHKFNGPELNTYLHKEYAALNKKK